MEGEDLYSDFGDFDGGDGKPQTVAAAEPRPAGGVAVADAAAAGPRPPLVIVPAGAADLYADLFDSEGGGGSTLLKTQVAELTNRVQHQDMQLAALQQEVGRLTQQNGELSGRCTTLATNISALYNTAKLELQRKDTEIQQLRERLAAAPGSARGRPPAPVVPGRTLPGSLQQAVAPPVDHRGPADTATGPSCQQQQAQGQQERRHEPQQAWPNDRVERSSSGQNLQPPSSGSGRRDDERRREDQRHEPGRSTLQYERSSGVGGSDSRDSRDRRGDGEERRHTSGRDERRRT